MTEERKGPSLKVSENMNALMARIHRLDLPGVGSMYPNGVKLTSNDLLTMAGCHGVTGDVFWYFYDIAVDKPSRDDIFQYIVKENIDSSDYCLSLAKDRFPEKFTF
jgi:hypothetical protein